MNEHYKFRVWNKDHFLHDSLFIDKEGYVWQDTSSYGETSFSKIEDAIICQSTGFRDRNWNIIFEYDILQIETSENTYINNVILRRRYGSGDFGFGELDEVYFGYRFNYWAQNMPCKIIGNYFENRNLLK